MNSSETSVLPAMLELATSASDSSRAVLSDTMKTRSCPKICQDERGVAEARRHALEIR